MDDQVSSAAELWRQVGRGVFVGMWAWTVTAYFAYLAITAILPGLG